MPKVSVIIPAFNPGRFLRMAIDSVHNQSFTDWELVVVDDNSTEDLSWVVQEFPRARLMRQPHGGVSVARNNGILSSTGEYVAFMDQDDMWRPAKLAHQIAVMEADATLAVCYCDLELLHGDGSVDNTREVSPLQASPVVVELGGKESSPTSDRLSSVHRSARYFASRFVVPSTVMLRRACLATSGLLDPFIPFSGDFDLLIKLGASHGVAHLPCVDVLYRKHGNNFSDQYDVGRAEVEALISRYTAYARSKGDRALERDARRLFGRPASLYAAQAVDCARRCLKAGQMAGAVRHLARACCFSPIFVVRSLWHWLAERFGGRKPKPGD